MEDRSYLRGGGEHSLSLTNRQQLALRGVTHVHSFDDTEIALETHLGALTIKGEELDIKQLDLQSGNAQVDGYVTALIYSDPKSGRGHGAKGILKRIFR